MGIMVFLFTAHRQAWLKRYLSRCKKQYWQSASILETSSNSDFFKRLLRTAKRGITHRRCASVFGTTTCFGIKMRFYQCDVKRLLITKVVTTFVPILVSFVRMNTYCALLAGGPRMLLNLHWPFWKHVSLWLPSRSFAAKLEVTIYCTGTIRVFRMLIKMRNDFTCFLPSVDYSSM